MENSLSDDTQILTISMQDVSLAGFEMDAASGRDLVAKTAHESGWWSFEQPLPAVTYKICKNVEGLFIDVGANTGFYSLLATSSNEDLYVKAFEPDPVVRQHLVGNIDRNDMQKRINVRAVALSNNEGSAPLYIPLQGHGLVETSSSLNSQFKHQHSSEVEVSVSTLDAALLDENNVALIKVDVEGHEREVLEGGEALIARTRPYLAIEMLDRAEFDFFNAFILRHRYRAYRLRFHEAVAESSIRFDPEAWNHILLPEERDGEFRSFLSELQIPVTEA